MIDRDVSLKVGEQTWNLSPTLSAMKAINRRFGSLRDAYQAVQAVDFEGVCFIVATGAAMTQKQAQTLEEAVLSHGVAKVAADVVPYLAVLMNPNDDEEDGDSGKA